MTSLEDKTQGAFEVLRSLGHTEFVYLLADLYSIRGWEPSITTGDPEEAGDLVANQILPEPKSLAVYYYDTEGLSKDKLSERFDRLQQDQLIVIVDGAPSDEAISFSHRHPVSIIGVGDIAKEIVFSSTLDVLRDHIPEESPLLDEHEGLFSQLPEQPERNNGTVDEVSTDSEDDQSIDDRSDESVGVDDGHTMPVTSSTLSEDVPGTEGEFYGMEYLGHDFVTGDEESGTLVAIEAFAKDYDITIRSENFTIQTESDYSYQGSDGRDIDLLGSIVGQLSSLWKGSGMESEIPTGGRVKILLFFDTSGPVNIKNIRYSGTYQFLFSMHWEQLEKETGYDAKHKFSTDIILSTAPSSDDQLELPTEIQSEISQLGYTISDME